MRVHSTNVGGARLAYFASLSISSSTKLGFTSGVEVRVVRGFRAGTGSTLAGDGGFHEAGVGRYVAFEVSDLGTRSDSCAAGWASPCCRRRLPRRVSRRWVLQNWPSRNCAGSWPLPAPALANRPCCGTTTPPGPCWSCCMKRGLSAGPGQSADRGTRNGGRFRSGGAAQAIQPSR